MAATSTLRTATIVRYAIGSIGTGGFGTLPGLVLVFYLTDTLGVAAIWAGVLVTAAKVWDVIIDPWIGARSDRSLAQTGFRRRFMLLGTIFLPVFFVLTFAVPAGLGPVWSGVWVFVAFILAATAYSLFQVPYIALPAELVSGYDQRTRLLSARVVVLTLGILIFGGGMPALRGLVDDEYLGYLLMGAAAAVIFFVAFLITSGVEKTAQAGGPPPVPSSDPVDGLDAPQSSLLMHFRRGWRVVKDSQPYRALLATFLLQALATGLMLAGASYIANSVLDSRDAVTLLFLALIAPALVFTPVWGAVANRIGKERSFLIASIVYGVAALSMVLLVWAPGLWVYAPVAICGAAYAGMQSLPLAMLPDVVAHDATTNGPGRAGSFSGVWTAGETAGLALGTTILTIILAVTGYVESTGNETVDQPAAAVVGIILSFSIVPAMLMAVSLVTLARYPLRKKDIDGLVHDTAAPPAGAPVA